MFVIMVLLCFEGGCFEEEEVEERGNWSSKGEEKEEDGGFTGFLLLYIIGLMGMELRLILRLRLLLLSELLSLLLSSFFFLLSELPLLLLLVLN